MDTMIPLRELRMYAGKYRSAISRQINYEDLKIFLKETNKRVDEVFHVRSPIYHNLSNYKGQVNDFRELVNLVSFIEHIEGLYFLPETCLLKLETENLDFNVDYLVSNRLEILEILRLASLEENEIWQRHKIEIERRILSNRRFKLGLWSVAILVAIGICISFMKVGLEWWFGN